MDGGPTGCDAAWRASLHCAVHARLAASLDLWSANVAPGTAAIVGRAIDRFRGAGARETVARLEALSIAISRLQQAARAPGQADCPAARHALRRLTRDWLESAPMFPGEAESAPLRLAA